MIIDVVCDALIDSAKMVPLLLAIYILIDAFEFKFGSVIKERVGRAASAGPLVGAVAGAIPQCGFSVIATALYTQRLATIGTLLAVYLSTSDEAVPIMMSQPQGVAVLIPFVLTKIIIAIIAGYSIDLMFAKKIRKRGRILRHTTMARIRLAIITSAQAMRSLVAAMSPTPLQENSIPGIFYCIRCCIR